jgi:hypothetical protein
MLAAARNYEAAKERNTNKKANEWRDFSDITWEDFKTFKQVRSKPFKTYINESGMGYYVNDKGEKKYGSVAVIKGIGETILPYGLNATPSVLRNAVEKPEIAPPKGYTFETESYRFDPIEPTEEDEEFFSLEIGGIDTGYGVNNAGLVINTENSYIGYWDGKQLHRDKIPTLKTISDFREVKIDGKQYGANEYGDLIDSDANYIGKFRDDERWDAPVPWYWASWLKDHEPLVEWKRIQESLPQ